MVAYSIKISNWSYGCMREASDNSQSLPTQGVCCLLVVTGYYNQETDVVNQEADPYQLRFCCCYPKINWWSLRVKL